MYKRNATKECHRGLFSMLYHRYGVVEPNDVIVVINSCNQLQLVHVYNHE